jgi:hypothetical protein
MADVSDTTSLTNCSCWRHNSSSQVLFFPTAVNSPLIPFMEIAVMILRIWALYGRRARVLWWLIGIASSFIAIAVVSATLSQIVPVPTRFSGACIRGNTASRSPSCRDVTLQSTNPRTPHRLCGCVRPELNFHLVHIVRADNSIRLPPPFKIFSAGLDLAGPWECLFAFDAMIFGMTTYKGYVTRRDTGDVNMPIHRLLVRDGASYGFNILTCVLTEREAPCTLCERRLSCMGCED